MLLFDQGESLMRLKNIGILLLCIIVLISAFPGWAQEESIYLTVGESRIFDYKGVTRVATSNPGVIELVVTSASEVIANAKTVGLATVHIWHGGKRTSFRMEVGENYTSLAKEMSLLIGIPTVNIRMTAKTVVLEGSVPTDLEMARVEQIARTYRDTVLNFLKVEESYQVLLSVLITEIRLDDIKSLGIEWGSMSVTDGKIIGTSMIWQYLFEANKYDSVEVRNPMDQRRISPVGARLTHLFQNGNARLLAAPSILVQSGKKAHFLVGGEIPLPIRTDQGILVEWKEYGVRLEAKPSIERDNMINLTIIPEVSNLDWANAIIVSDMRIPAVATRRAETQLSIASGSTMALGGLLQREDSKTVNRVPGLGKLPIIGRIFQSSDYRQGLTELVIFVTPSIVPMGQSPDIERIIPKGTPAPEVQSQSQQLKGEN